MNISSLITAFYYVIVLYFAVMLIWQLITQKQLSMQIAIAIALIVAVVVPYYRRTRRREHEARQRYERAKVSGLQAAVSLHPHIDGLTAPPLVAL